MIARLVLRGTAARWRRSVLVAVAVAIGVAFVCGSLLVAASVRASYSRSLHQVTSTVDVYVRGPETDRHRGISDFAPLPATFVPTVAGVQGVGVAEGQITRLAQLVTPSGRFLGVDRQIYVYSWLATPRLLPFVLAAGHPPEGPGQVVLDTASAAAFGLVLGSPVRVSIDVSTPLPAHVVGLVKPRSRGDLAGSTAVFVDAGWAQDVVGIGDSWDLIEVDVARGTSAETLRDRIERILPDDGTSVVTGKQYAAALVADLSRRAGPVSALLVALSALALAVGFGVVVSTQQIVLRHRAQELSLLRIAGMTRGQLYRMVLGEAAVLGAVASVVGALAGVPAAMGLRALAGRTTPLPPVQPSLSIPLATAAAGLVLTVVACGLPARRATSVRPVEAWRTASMPDPPAQRSGAGPAHGAGVGPAHGAGGGRAIGCMIAVGLAAVVLGVFGPRPSRVIASVSGAVLLGAAALAWLPVGGSTAARLLGRPSRRANAPRPLASAHASAEPRRITAPALVLAAGVGLVCCVSVLSSSTAASIKALVRRADRADLVVVSDAAPGIDPEAVEAIRDAPAVATVTELGADTFTVNGRNDQFTALDTDTAALTLNLPVLAGTLDGFVDGDIAITRSAAIAHHLRVGDYVQTRFGIPQLRYLEVTAIIADNGVTRDWIVPFETYRRGDFTTPIRTVFVKGVTGVAPARLIRQVDVGVGGFPGVSVYGAAAYANEQARQAEGPVELVDALVGLAIAIALLGVADILGLGVVERLPEMGLLATLGMTPRQLSATVRWESVLIATLGTTAGVAGGLAVGLALAMGLRAEALSRLSVPLWRLVAVVVATNAAALMAAALPARRAGRVDGLVLVNA